MEKMRSFPRLSLACDIEFTVETEAIDNREPVKSKTKDISRGGICLITTSPLKTGDILHIRIRLKGSGALFEAKGKVVWTQTFEIGGQKGYDNGIEFIDIPEAHQGMLEQFIQKMFGGLP